MNIDGRSSSSALYWNLSVRLRDSIDACFPILENCTSPEFGE